VSDSEPTPTLEDTGFAAETTARIGSDRARQLVACIDADPGVLAGGELPALWHWVCFVPDAPTSALGPDGHPRRRPELDEFPQRMWVGGRVRVDAPLALDVDARRTSRIVSSDLKDGSTGRFWLVTVEHEIAQAGRTCVVEEQDLVLRQAVIVADPGSERTEPPEDEWVEALDPDPVLLFRFSAVTNNAHRIHYDARYATGAEGYPALVVQGPLLAVLLTQFAERHTARRARSIAFRARAPHFVDRRLWLTGHAEGDGARTAAVRGDGVVAMTLDADA
jgi:3-methylfumaryl-CoA hydratase